MLSQKARLTSLSPVKVRAHRVNPPSRICRIASPLPTDQGVADYPHKTPAANRARNSGGAGRFAPHG